MINVLTNFFTSAGVGGHEYHALFSGGSISRWQNVEDKKYIFEQLLSVVPTFDIEHGDLIEGMKTSYMMLPSAHHALWRYPICRCDIPIWLSDDYVLLVGDPELSIIVPTDMLDDVDCLFLADYLVPQIVAVWRGSELIYAA